MGVKALKVWQSAGDSIDATDCRPALSRRMVLEHSVTVSAPPEAAWRFLENLETNYPLWHPEDHKVFVWTRGTPLAKGSTLYSEQYMAGKLVQYDGVIAESIPLKKVVMRFSLPVSLITDGIEWKLDGRGHSTVFTASTHLRFGLVARTFFKKRLYRLIAEHDRHVGAEGENLRRILEATEGGA